MRGNGVGWGGFRKVGVTADGVVCASHVYPTRGGTCEATPLFDLRSMSLARPLPGVRCVVRGNSAMQAIVGSATPGSVAIGSGGYWGRFGEVCNEALSPDGTLFARVESTPANDGGPILGNDLHLAIFDARNAKRQADVTLGEPGEGALDSLWIEFVSDTVVDVSTEHEVTWRVDISTGRVVRGPGTLLQSRSGSGRWALNEFLFDFESGKPVSWPWWTDVAEGALDGFVDEPRPSGATPHIRASPRCRRGRCDSHSWHPRVRIRPQRPCVQEHLAWSP
ncbi:MAG: hypothetical protein JW940_00780 [Polyangiaceae bacterium]|nr:hypothetical protein [Polyangiaceae bacterium]